MSVLGQNTDIWKDFFLVSIQCVIMLFNLTSLGFLFGLHHFTVFAVTLLCSAEFVCLHWRGVDFPSTTWLVEDDLFPFSITGFLQQLYPIVDTVKVKMASFPFP